RDSIFADHGAREDENRGEDTGLRKAEAASPADHQQGQSAKPGEVNQRGSRGAAEAEGDEEQHLAALREIGIQAVVIPVESVVAPDANHVSQVISATV